MWVEGGGGRGGMLVRRGEGRREGWEEVGEESCMGKVEG